MPLQVPAAYEQKFSFIKDKHRRLMHAMVHFMDEEIGEMVQLLKERQMWNNSLVVFHSDNGGEIIFKGICGGNNWPLRGGKFSNFEGGIRVNAFVTGGWVPESRRGQKLEGLVTAWDWYATYAALAGVDPEDHQAADFKLPPLDSKDVWPWLSGAAAASPREEVVIGETSAHTPNGDGQTVVGGVIRGRYKLLLGVDAHKWNSMFLTRQVSQNVMTGPQWPNSSSHLIPMLHPRHCGRQPEHGCLFEAWHGWPHWEAMAMKKGDECDASSLLHMSRDKDVPKKCAKPGEIERIREDMLKKAGKTATPATSQGAPKAAGDGCRGKSILCKTSKSEANCKFWKRVGCSWGQALLQKDTDFPTNCTHGIQCNEDGCRCANPGEVKQITEDIVKEVARAQPLANEEAPADDACMGEWFLCKSLETEESCKVFQSEGCAWGKAALLQKDMPKGCKNGITCRNGDCRCGGWTVFAPNAACMHLRIVDLSGTAASTSQALQLAWQRQRTGRVAFSVPRVSCRCAKLGETEGATPPEGEACTGSSHICAKLTSEELCWKLPGCSWTKETQGL
ncbi:unnamed protein product [Cladocopium goreaui]|uniref:Arylsulfatase B n=1 Tax=Cladocopium goreaui TaxID=2562237 RepID=A0A9P1CH33_9DINO|nr:unnamed protein product [Cladocopium goreaui]